MQSISLSGAFPLHSNRGCAFFLKSSPEIQLYLSASSHTNSSSAWSKTECSECISQSSVFSASFLRLFAMLDCSLSES